MDKVQKGRFFHGKFFLVRHSCYTEVIFTLLYKYAKQKIFSVVSELEMKQIMNGATTSFSETPSVTLFGYQNFSGSHQPQITPHSTDSELPCASYYSNF
jgi:hypothetical protein